MANDGKCPSLSGVPGRLARRLSRPISATAQVVETLVSNPLLADRRRLPIRQHRLADEWTGERQNPIYVLVNIDYLLMVISYWLLVIGYWSEWIHQEGRNKAVF